MTTSRSDRPLSGAAVLVVGGRGFVGAHVVRALLAEGARVHVFGPPMQDDLLADVAGAFVDRVGSIAERREIAAAIAASRASHVVSFAAHGVDRMGLMRSGESDADGAMAVNVVGLGHLLEAAQAAGVRRVVWASSTVVYGPPQIYGAAPVDESATLAPMTFYGVTKQLGEALAAWHARRFGLEVTALRLPLVLGAGLWYQGAAAALNALFAQAARGEATRLLWHDETVDLMHVDDAARAFVAAAGSATRLAGAYNILGFRARADELLAEIARQRPGLTIARDHAAPALSLPLVDAAAFTRDTGFAPRYDLSRFVAAMLSRPAQGAAP